MRFCIILGAPKAGTTSLFNYLAQHPEIAPCNQKEPNYFTKYYGKGDDWYLSQWDNHPENMGKIRLEATVNYTNSSFSIEASRNMSDFHDNHECSMKFIYIMRNPIKRLESHYTYNYAHMISWSLETALQKGYIIHTSQYARQLDRYFQKFNSDDFLLLDFDTLKKDPRKLLKKTCSFLNIDPEFSFTGLEHIHNKSIGKPVTRPLENLYRRYPFLEQIAAFIPKGLKRFIQKLIIREKITKKFTLNVSQRRRVFCALKDDMKHLHKTYGVDTEKWGF